MHYQVVIIGAGMAGLGAAYELSKHSIINLLVLEAQGSPGGRISTIDASEGILELGAQWLHDTENELYHLAVKHNLIHPELSDEGLGIYIRNDGYVYDSFLVKKVDFHVGKILENCENFVDSITYPKSLGDYLDKEFNNYLESLDECKEIKLLMRQLLDWHVRFQLIDNSCSDLKQLSAKDWGRYKCLGKDGQKHLNIKGGYRALVQIIMEILPPELKISYNTVVNELKFNDNCVEIFCENNVRITADHVILTPSLGVLKNLKFPATNHVETALQCMGFDGMGKVFLVFERKWWHHAGFQLIWKENASNKNWTSHFSGFENVLDQPKVLMGWLSPLGVKEMENLSEEQVGKECVDLLKSFLKNIYVDIPYPLKVVKTSWCSNPFICGAYSHSTSKCDESKLFCAEELSKPMCDNKNVPRILVAGEAAHSNHFSTTHGAFESGQSKALQLAALCKNKI